jgi:multiple sugar transport system ATP-binding protein
VTYAQASRIYAGTERPAVDGLDLEIPDGEFLVLVGPSGSGKSTALRMLAGLEPLDDGKILIGDRDVSQVRPRDRDIAMVFQNYALYPQLSVADNMGFPLKQRGVPKDERRRMVTEAAAILDLEPYLDRKPRQLSGGQRQRVAMGRAIVRSPQVFLMDEPLSNLDAKLRVQTRTELAELQERLGVTTVYVTHDQVEAMTLGHRVAVLSDGVLQQCDTPQDLYHRPANVFVAGFIGSPAMNLVETGGDGAVRLGSVTLQVAPTPGDADPVHPIDLSAPVTIGFRPEAVTVGHGPLQGTIRTVEDLGSEVFVHLLVHHRGHDVAVVAKTDPPFDGKPHDTVALDITGVVHLFDATGRRVTTAPMTLVRHD